MRVFRKTMRPRHLQKSLSCNLVQLIQIPDSCCLSAETDASFDGESYYCPKIHIKRRLPNQPHGVYFSDIRVSRIHVQKGDVSRPCLIFRRDFTSMKSGLQDGKQMRTNVAVLSCKAARCLILLSFSYRKGLVKMSAELMFSMSYGYWVGTNHRGDDYYTKFAI